MTKFKINEKCKDKFNATWTITRRTEKTVWAFSDEDGEVKRFKISIVSDCEHFRPYGTYSQAPYVKPRGEK